MKIFNTKTFQVLTNVSGALGYTFLFFGLGIMIMLGVILLQVHGLFPGDYKLNIDEGTQVIYLDIPKLAESVTNVVAIGLGLLVVFFMITLPYWVGKYSSIGLKAMLTRLTYPVNAKKLLLGKVSVIATCVLLLVILFFLTADTKPFLVLGLVFFALATASFAIQHLLARWARLSAKSIW